MALGLLSSLALALTGAPPVAPYVVVRSATAAIALEEEAGDVLVIDGKLEIHGVVRGFVYAVDSEVIAKSSAVLLKPISLRGGALRIEEGAVLPGVIDLHSARLHRPHGAVLRPEPGRRSTLSLGPSVVNLRDEPLTGGKLALMKSALPFDRFVPGAESSLAGIAAWHPGLGLELKRNLTEPAELVVGGIARLTFVSGQVKGAFQRGYRGARGTVLLSGAELVDQEAASAFWKQLAAIPEDRVGSSVRSALGDGGHWFFRHRDRICMLWQRGRWFFSVETRLGADDTSIGQEAQFSEQVLNALRTELFALEQVKP